MFVFEVTVRVIVSQSSRHDRVKLRSKLNRWKMKMPKRKNGTTHREVPVPVLRILRLLSALALGTAWACCVVDVTMVRSSHRAQRVRVLCTSLEESQSFRSQPRVPPSSGCHTTFDDNLFSRDHRGELQLKDCSRSALYIIYAIPSTPVMQGKHKSTENFHKRNCYTLWIRYFIWYYCAYFVTSCLLAVEHISLFSTVNRVQVVEQVGIDERIPTSIVKKSVWCACQKAGGVECEDV